MQPIGNKRLRCRCGCTEVRGYIPSTHDQVGYFLAGDPAGTMRQSS